MDIRKENIDSEYSGTEDPTPEEQPPSVEVFSNNLPLDNMVLRSTTMDMLNIPVGARSSAETLTQVDSILRWASENAPDKELGTLLETIQRQVRMMGAQLKEDKVQRLYRYVRLNSQRLAVETQMKALYG